MREGRPGRAGELWLAGNERYGLLVALVVDSYGLDRFGEPSVWTHRAVDLGTAAGCPTGADPCFEVEERVIVDLSSTWRRLA